MEIALKIRNVLLKSFVIALILLISWHVFYFFNMDFVVKVFEYIYGIDPDDAVLSIVTASNIMKIIIIVFFLIPALAIHCEFAKCKCKIFEKEGEDLCENK